MHSPTLSVGDRIQARCTKCRKNLDHLLLSLNEESPDQVQCLTCERRHKYRPVTPATKPSATRPGNLKAAERKEWEDLRPGMNSADAKDYSMTGAYRVKSLINHPLFGLGLVQRIVGERKVEVLFEDGRKTMRCK